MPIYQPPPDWRIRRDAAKAAYESMSAQEKREMDKIVAKLKIPNAGHATMLEILAAIGQAMSRVGNGDSESS